MSHFITAVITKNPQKYEEELAPFDEQTEDRRFLEFVDRTEKLKNMYENETTEKVKLPDGSYISSSSDKIKVSVSKDEYDNLNGTRGYSNGEYYKYDPSVVGGELAKVPYKELYKTFKEFADYYEGEDAFNEEKQAYGYWHNPNARWDYYSLCAQGNYGRWQCAKIEDAFIKVKDFVLYNNPQELMDEYNKAKEAADKVEKGIEKITFALTYGGYKDAEDYATKNRIKAPWAFVLDGHWAERGEMGWWAMSDATDESEDAFKKLFEKICSGEITYTDEKIKDYEDFIRKAYK